MDMRKGSFRQACAPCAPSAHGLVKLQPSKAVASLRGNACAGISYHFGFQLETDRHVHLDRAFYLVAAGPMRVRTIEIAAACLVVLSLLGCYITSLFPEAESTHRSR